MSAVKVAILQTLQADTGTGGVAALATGGIYPDVAPEGATFPYVTVTPSRSPSANRVYQAVAFEESVYLVKAIDKQYSESSLFPIVARVRALLDGATLTIEGYESRAVLWQNDLEYAETQDGATYRHKGGFYYVMAEEV